MLFGADKISNTHALRLALARNSEGSLTVGLAEKIRPYRRSVELLEDLEPDAPLVHRRLRIGERSRQLLRALFQSLPGPQRAATRTGSRGLR